MPSLPGIGTISDIKSQGTGGSITRDPSGSVAPSTSTLTSVAGGGSGGSVAANPNTPTSTGSTPNAANPNAGGDSQAMNELVNMRISQSPSLRIAQQDAAARIAGSGLQNGYTPTGHFVSGGSGGGSASQLIADAKSWLGVPYAYGGTSRSGVDCSGFTQAVYGQMGINIGRDTSAQFRSGQVVGVDRNWNATIGNLQPGDLIFYGQPGASGPNAHVVMYIGNGQVIQAAHTGTNVAIGPLFSSASTDEPFLGVRRYLTSTPGNPNPNLGNQPNNINGWISQALSATGQNPGLWAEDLGLIAQHESSDNPNAVNRWDSNAAAGHPSQGLMQLIPSNFSQYAPASLRGRGILDPVANIAAAINYIIARYGSVDNVPGVRAVDQGRSYVGY